MSVWRCAEGVLLASVMSVVLATSAAAQDHEHMNMSTTAPSWSFSWDARVFVGWNYQYRKFRDFQRVESQNWFMADAQRDIGAGHLRLKGMFSMEPFTIQPLGSPEVFQTGETYQQAPLIDYQHPHDLFMTLGAVYDWNFHSTRMFVEGDAVGEPALGPTWFMHRASAAENPTAPLGHHMLDSTHITPGVIT